MQATAFVCAGLSFEPLEACAERDLMLLREWRNQPRIRKELLTTHEVSVDEHLAWARARDLHRDHTFMVYDLWGQTCVGSVALYNIDGDVAEFGRLMIGNEAYLGKRLGTVMTLGVLDYGFRHLGLKRIRLAVREANTRAMQVYFAAGFKMIEERSMGPAIVMMEARAPERRSWDKWDQRGVVDRIECFWKADGEREHRKWLASNILGRMPLGPDESVTEVGCGTGEVYAALRELGLPNDSYTGVDSSYQMLALAARKHPQGEFVWGDVLNTNRGPISAISADHVICAEVLGHMPDPVPALETLCYESRKRLFLSVWTGQKDEVQCERVGDTEFVHHVYRERDILCVIRSFVRGAKIEVCRGPRTTLFVVEHAPSPKHTVILGSFNRPKMVRAAIRSVKSQTTDDWQLIVTDDGSNAETMAAIAEEIKGDARCEVLRFTGPSPQEGPRSGAQVRAIERINDALPLVRGQLVHYLPDDDFYEPTRFEAFQKKFQDPQVHMVYGRLRWAHVDGSPQSVTRDIFPGEPVTDPIGLLDHTQVVHRSHCLDVVREWQTADINYDSDGRFFKKLINAGFGPIRPMDWLVSYHREHGLNMIVVKDAITSKREP